MNSALDAIKCTEWNGLLWLRWNTMIDMNCTKSDEWCWAKCVALSKVSSLRIAPIEIDSPGCNLLHWVHHIVLAQGNILSKNWLHLVKWVELSKMDYTGCNRLHWEQKNMLSAIDYSEHIKLHWIKWITLSERDWTECTKLYWAHQVEMSSGTK